MNEFKSQNQRYSESPSWSQQGGWGSMLARTAAEASLPERLAFIRKVYSLFFVATLFAIGLIDRWGRKPLLLIGSIGMTCTLTALAIIFGTAGSGLDGRPQLSHAAAVVGLVAANLYIVAFGVSWGPVMWVLLGEMFPNRLRGAALAVSGATNWAANFAVTVTFLPLLKGAGLASAYGLYAGAALISFLFVWFTVRETKGKTLEQVKSQGLPEPWKAWDQPPIRADRWIDILYRGLSPKSAK